MELNRTRNWFYALLAAAVGFIIILGGWWLFLVFKLASAVEAGEKSALPSNLALMVKWEGFTFLILTLALGAALIYVFWQDHKKTRSLQTFYASLTHELKTPLASMRLQAQVLAETIDSLSLDQTSKEKVARYGKRLQEDVSRLESELDKHLQLSRTEGGGNLTISPVALIPLIQSEKRKFPSLSVKLDVELDDPIALADRTALGIIFKNLFENTVRHSGKENPVANILIKSSEETVRILYRDEGEAFTGDPGKLGKLFYKHDSPKGSGIGLYLARKLAKAQGGKLKVNANPSLSFELCLVKGAEDE